MEETDPQQPQPDEALPTGVFVADHDRHNKPGRIVTLGHYYPQAQISAVGTLLRETNEAGYAAGGARADKIRQNREWTRLINALNKERRWPLKRLFAMLDLMLERDIALAVVPPHIAYAVPSPVRELARMLAVEGRVDASSCLVRRVTIRRIIYGGPSTRALHRETIVVENPELVRGRRVLLLDDIAKSGASLMACRELLYEAGAALVQAAALGRLIVPSGT